MGKRMGFLSSVLGPWTLKRCCGWSECFSQAVGYVWGPPQRQALCVWKVNESKQNCNTCSKILGQKKVLIFKSKDLKAIKGIHIPVYSREDYVLQGLKRYKYFKSSIVLLRYISLSSLLSSVNNCCPISYFKEHAPKSYCSFTELNIVSPCPYKQYML